MPNTTHATQARKLHSAPLRLSGNCAGSCGGIIACAPTVLRSYAARSADHGFLGVGLAHLGTNSGSRRNPYRGREASAADMRSKTEMLFVPHVFQQQVVRA